MRVWGASLLGLVGWSGVAGAAAPMQPDPRGLSRPDRAFDLERLALDIVLHPDDRSLTGRGEYTLRRLFPGPLVFDQVGLDIHSVTVDGAPTEWWVDDHRLVVPLHKQDTLTLVVEWDASPDTGVHFRSARATDAFDEVWTQGESQDHRHWFPAVDHPGDRFEYAGSVHAPDGWKVMTNSGDDLVNYLVMFAAGQYVEHVHADRPSVSVWVPPGTDMDAVSAVLDPVPAMMAVFAQRTGVPYPWGDYRQIFVQRFRYFGMENTGATINAQSALVGAHLNGTRPGIERLVAHELAHQWFGDLLTCRSWQELWLNEGFARFMEAEWFREAYGPEALAELVLWWQGRAKGSAPLAGRFHQGPGHPVHGRVYMLGASVLHGLREMLGEDRFWEGIQLYVRRHAHSDVETRDLQRALEDVTGQNLDWYFQQWTELAVRPVLTVGATFGDGHVDVHVAQTVDGTHPAFVMPVVVEAKLKSGDVVRTRGWLEGGSLNLRLDAVEAPTWVAFDPAGGLLADVDLRISSGMLSALVLDEQGPPHARLRAMRALAKDGEADALKAVLERSSAHPAMRREAARGLGEQAALDALLPSAQDPDNSVRLEVVKALGRCFGPTLGTTLRTVALGDTNPDVQGAALRGLANVAPADAVVVARRLARAGSGDEDQRTGAAFEVLGRHGEVRDLKRLLGDHPRRLSSQAYRAATVLVSRQESETLRQDLGAKVARMAEARLRDDDELTRTAMVAILGEVGDSRSVALLMALRSDTHIDALASRCTTAIDAIRTRPSDTVPVGDNALEARLKALEERLSTLEGTTEDLHGEAGRP